MTGIMKQSAMLSFMPALSYFTFLYLLILNSVSLCSIPCLVNSHNVPDHLRSLQLSFQIHLCSKIRVRLNKNTKAPIVSNKSI